MSSAGNGAKKVQWGDAVQRKATIFEQAWAELPESDLVMSLQTNSILKRAHSASAARYAGHYIVASFGVILGVACLTGCASLPKPKPEWSVYRPVDTANTTWARVLLPEQAEHQGSSGIQLLPYGHDALSARLALIDTAERSLDLQYYIWKPDNTGQLLIERLLSAADRGVRVRLLLDDIGGSASDAALLALDTHTNIEVRLFNPIAFRSVRKLGMLFEFQRISRRMHNKSFTADRLLTILGGRNVEDRYYGFGEESRFADFDVIAAGTAAEEVAAMFDRYWISPYSIPIYALTRKHSDPERLAELRTNLTSRVEVITNLPGFKTLAGNGIGSEIRNHKPNLVWGPTRLLCDLPEKITTDPNDTSTHLLPELRDELDNTKREFFVVSPYFVPGQNGVEFFRSLRKRGVRVIVLSNSLAANDVTAVHVGYRRYRKALLRAGVEMWEIKPDLLIRGKGLDDNPIRKSDDESPGSGLHAKAFFFDQRALFVGSLNLDPHSVSLNTEMGLLIEIPQLARPAVESLEKSLAQNAYRLEFVPGPGPCKECGSIVWHSLEDGRDVVYKHEPRATICQRLQILFLSFLPIESQL